MAEPKPIERLRKDVANLIVRHGDVFVREHGVGDFKRSGIYTGIVMRARPVLGAKDTQGVQYIYRFECALSGTLLQSSMGDVAYLAALQHKAMDVLVTSRAEGRTSLTVMEALAHAEEGVLLWNTPMAPRADLSYSGGESGLGIEQQFVIGRNMEGAWTVEPVAET